MLKEATSNCVRQGNSQLCGSYTLVLLTHFNQVLWHQFYNVFIARVKVQKAKFFVKALAWKKWHDKFVLRHQRMSDTLVMLQLSPFYNTLLAHFIFNITLKYYFQLHKILRSKTASRRFRNLSAISYFRPKVIMQSCSNNISAMLLQYERNVCT